MAFRKPAQKVPSSGCLQKAAIVEGIMAMDWAKMMGRTPDMLTLMGRLVD